VTKMKTFRITYTKTIKSIVEIDAKTPGEAWKKIKSEELEGDDLIWMREGELTYKVEQTEEVTRHIASNPS
jgi:hypothetical protein